MVYFGNEATPCIGIGNLELGGLRNLCYLYGFAIGKSWNTGVWASSDLPLANLLGQIKIHSAKNRGIGHQLIAYYSQ